MVVRQSLLILKVEPFDVVVDETAKDEIGDRASLARITSYVKNGEDIPILRL